jgi:multisubunit Na+/H+ antiporter MnhE subunit
VTRWLLALAALTLTYALVLASADPRDLLAGALVSAGVLLLFGRFLFGGRPAPLPRLGARLVALPGLVWAVLRDITVGTWQVAAVVVGLRPLERPGIVVVPFGERSDAAALVGGFVATLAPGEYLVDVDWERRLLVMHVLDAADPDAVRARFDDFYRRHQRAVVA